MLFNSSVAVITGAGRGIGKVVAKTFAAKGFVSIVADINVEDGETTVSEIRDLGGSASFVRTDVSSVSGIEMLMQFVLQNFGRIDVLVNNAGLSEFYDPLLIDEMTWNRVLDTNLKSVFFCSREAAKVMKENGGGSIVNIASTRAIMSEPNSEAYAASKGGILALTHALSASFSNYHISVNAILPGWIENGDYSALREVDHKQHFSGRVGKPDDIARACLFLSDSENDFITGVQLVVDGGMTRKMIYEE